MEPAAEETIRLNSTANRESMARLVINLFDLWQISVSDQLNLLGLSKKSRFALKRYRAGGAISKSRDRLDRIGWLLSIHKSLRLLFPENKEFRCQWVSKRNAMLDNRRPIDVMKEKGIIGIATVARHLECLSQQ